MFNKRGFKKMATIYISRENKKKMDELRIQLIVKKKIDVKKAELFDAIIKEGIKKIKEKESL